MLEETSKNSILDKWKKHRKENDPRVIDKAPADSALVLSHGQQRLWFLQQLFPENPFYNYTEAYVFNGSLDVEKLFQALQSVYDTHDVLRSTYTIKNDGPVVEIGAKIKLTVKEYDVREKLNSVSEKSINDVLLADALKPFDLENGPVTRFSLFKLSNDEHILLLTMHHIVTDKWSMGIFKQQLATNYLALCAGEELVLKKTAIEYHDYAHWQRKLTNDPKQEQYWFAKLSGEIPILNFPKDRSAPLRPSFKGAFNNQSFSKELSKSILALSSELEATPYVLLLSVYYMLLFRYTDQNDILIGSPISNRDQKSLEELIGFFNDTVVLRTNLDSNMSFKDLVKEVRKTTLEAFANKDVPFEDLVMAIKPERSLNVNPFFSVMFLYHAVPTAPNFGPDVEFSQKVLDTKVSKFDLTLYISEENERLTSIFEYATDLFDESTIERLQEHFLLLLEGIVRNADERISEISMLSRFEQELFFKEELPKPINKISFKGIHELIAEGAQKNLNKTAVTYGNDSITYQKLNERAEDIAHNILLRTKKENRIIGLYIERSVDMIVGLLGILKAGCAYLPLDPDYPVERIEFMLQDAEVPFIVTNAATLSEVEKLSAEVLNISKIEPSVKKPINAFPKSKEEDRAYVIYTSGSTGQPKGVPITHGNIVNATLGRTVFYDTDPTAFLLMSSIAFDSSKAGIFWALTTGGTLILSEKRLEQDIDRLTKTIAENKVSHTLMLPSLYKTILDYSDVNRLQSLSTVIVAGESCGTVLVKKHFEMLPNINLYNEYGPTEASVWCVAHKLDANNRMDLVPIGRPVANASVHILNESMKNVPYGAVGELCISGKGLSSGYLNLPDETAQRFVDITLNDNKSQRVYKTGDLARYNRNGAIEFLGRKDQQIKIRGFRIELEEIEKTVLSHDGIGKVAVVIDDGSKKLNVAEMGAIETIELLDTLEKSIALSSIDELLRSVEQLSEKELHFLSNNI